MSRPLFYMAHPVTEDVKTGVRSESNFLPNIERARKWLAWLMSNDNTRVYIAPWIIEVGLAVDKMLITTFEQAIADDVEVVNHCDGLILVGGNISTGMQAELDMARLQNKTVIDWSQYYEPWTIDSNAGHAARILLRHSYVTKGLHPEQDLI